MRDKAIILVGPTKQGKSTVFNWMSSDAENLKGIVIGSRHEYECQFENGAKAKGGLKSVTVIPNSHHPEEADYSLMDTAGYNDNRNHSEVIGVSYMLKGILDKVRQCKFVLVLQSSIIQDLDKVYDSIRGFLNMFKLDMMETEER